MANRLKTEKKITVLSNLTEGTSIRATERITGVHRDTIVRLGVRVGQACARLLDEKMRGLTCKNIQLDEIWGFINKKQRRVKLTDPIEFGDAYTFVAIDADTKLVPSFKVGKRDSETANAFLLDLSSRLACRVQLSSDHLTAYIGAVEIGFGGEVDYGQIVKTYEEDDLSRERRYSPGRVTGIEKTPLVGNPDENLISTSFVERQNLTMRMHCRRLTRLTNAFSKKLENFKAAIALHFAYYNFVKRHQTLRMTPAMAAGVERSRWTMADLLGAAGE